MSRKRKEYPALDDYRNYPAQFGLLDEISYLTGRISDYLDEELEAEKLEVYSDILGELNAALDLYFDLKAAVATIRKLLPSRGSLGRLIETPESQHLKGELSKLYRQLHRVAARVAALRKKFWAKVVELDPDLYPYDPSDFERHMADIETESFEL